MLRVFARGRWARAISYAKNVYSIRRQKAMQKIIELAMYLLRARRRQNLSRYAASTLQRLSTDPESRYHSAGVRQNAEKFKQALKQTNLLIYSAFTAADCLVLSSVLRHSLCDLQHLTLFEVDALHSNFEFDLVPAIGSCKSLRSLHILGGKWKAAALCTVLHLVQVESPRIHDVYVESIDVMEDLAPAITSAAGYLIADYFNYSAPGLLSLSLHGMGIQDRHLELICSGLECNRSLQFICLSCNLLEDNGFIAIFNAIIKNPRSDVQYLDLSLNLIKGENVVREMLESYVAANEVATDTYPSTLKISLLRNPLVDPVAIDIRVHMCLKIITKTEFDESTVSVSGKYAPLLGSPQQQRRKSPSRLLLLTPLISPSSYSPPSTAASHMTRRTPMGSFRDRSGGGLGSRRESEFNHDFDPLEVSTHTDLDQNSIQKWGLQTKSVPRAIVQAMKETRSLLTDSLPTAESDANTSVSIRDHRNQSVFMRKESSSIRHTGVRLSKSRQSTSESTREKSSMHMSQHQSNRLSALDMTYRSGRTYETLATDKKDGKNKGNPQPDISFRSTVPVKGERGKRNSIYLQSDVANSQADLLGRDTIEGTFASRTAEGYRQAYGSDRTKFL